MPWRVGEDLHLDVARVGQVALEVDGRVGEELLALARGALEGRPAARPRQRDAEALAAAAARRLDRDRDSRCPSSAILRAASTVVHRLGRARDDRHAGGLHQLARPRLGAHRVDRARRRADEDDPGLLAGAGERRVLGEEAVAGVHGLGAGLLDDLEDPLDVEVALGGRRAAEQVGLVGALDVQRVAVELGVDGDGGDAELVAARG